MVQSGNPDVNHHFYVILSCVIYRPGLLLTHESGRSCWCIKVLWLPAAEKKGPHANWFTGSLLFMIFSAVRTEGASAVESKSHQNHLLGALQPLLQEQDMHRGREGNTALRVQLAKMGITGERNI